MWELRLNFQASKLDIPALFSHYHIGYFYLLIVVCLAQSLVAFSFIVDWFVVLIY